MAGTPPPPRSSDKPSGDALDDTVPADETPARDEYRTRDETRGAHDDDVAPVRPTHPIDRYRIGNELGRGGMGRVVEAFDAQLNRTVAVKEILPKAGGGTTRRFAREIHITARLEHASIVPLYDSGINSDGKPFYVMRRVTGKPLDEMIARCRDLDERLTLLPSVLAAIDAVAHAHERGVIHRDLKPQNILVGEHGETVVIDWGLAKVVGEADDEESPDSISPGDSLRTQIGSVFGTPGFMAPEQARGEVTDLQGDVYALGAVLYQLLAATPPVAGNSATEVMDKTRTHDIRPLEETAPGAPHELRAIVSKALAFDPANRYPDAGALGEDVRRFTTGQLVAAHDYTTRQRLGRFARRYRGVLSVAALATVAVAVMAWIGVHRIVTERDAAQLARHQAELDRHEAELARDRLAERHDELIVMQAKSLLDANPTEAHAILKQLSPKSPRSDQARAIAQAATVRGVAWALETTHEHTTITAFDPEGRLLLQVSRDGMMRVFDLERRRLHTAKAFAPMSRAAWVLGSKLLVTHHEAAPQLFDPATGKVELLGLPPISEVEATTAGDRALIVTPGKTAAIYDAATRSLTPVAFPEPVESAMFAADGTWYAIHSKQLIIVFDRDGKELTRRVGPLAYLITSRFRSLAVVVAPAQIVECKLDPQPVWSDVPLAALAPHAASELAYRGSELTLRMSNGDIMARSPSGNLFKRAQVERFALFMREAGDETLIVPSGDGKLYWSNTVGRGTLTLPDAMGPRMRVSSRAGLSWVIVVGDGIIYVFDLAAVMPARIATTPNTRALFVDDDTLLMFASVEAPWQWFDLATRTVRPLELDELRVTTLWDVDHASGRVLLREFGPATRFLLFRKTSSKPEVIAEGAERGWARLVPGDAVIYGLGDGRVFGKIGTAPAKQVAKLDGVAEHGVGTGHQSFAARSSTGEIVRGDLMTGTLERVRVPVGSAGFVARDRAGRVLIVEDNRLLAWDTAVTELAKFDRPIVRVSAIAGGVAIHVGDESNIHVLELPAGGRPGQPVRVLSSSAIPPITSFDGKLVVGLGTGQSVTLVELPSRERWSLPVLFSASAMNMLLDVTPSSRKILQATGGALAVWQLPHAGPDLAAWLDGQTNATIGTGGVLGWPWQVAKSP